VDRQLNPRVHIQDTQDLDLSHDFCQYVNESFGLFTSQKDSGNFLIYFI
jgi:hypothetical protein